MEVGNFEKHKRLIRMSHNDTLFKKIFQKPTKKYILTTTSDFDIIFS